MTLFKLRISGKTTLQENMPFQQHQIKVCTVCTCYTVQKTPSELQAPATHFTLLLFLENHKNISNINKSPTYSHPTFIFAIYTSH